MRIVRAGAMADIKTIVDHSFGYGAGPLALIDEVSWAPLQGIANPLVPVQLADACASLRVRLYLPVRAARPVGCSGAAAAA